MFPIQQSSYKMAGSLLYPYYVIRY